MIDITKKLVLNGRLCFRIWKTLQSHKSKRDDITSSAVLEFKLLDGAKLNHRDRQLVLTGVDYTNRETLFEQMKKALRKFHGEQAIPSSSDPPAAIKVEPAIYNEEEAYYSKMSQYWKYNGNYSQQFR